jgi:hypothetical protein
VNQLLADAIDTAITLGWAFLIWLALVSLTAGLALYAVTVIAWWTLRALWRGLEGPSWRRGRLHARFLAHARARRSRRRTEPPQPQRARSQPHKEAA